MNEELEQKLTERFEAISAKAECDKDVRDALLKAYLAGGEYGYQYAQTNPNWISVADELPKCNIVDCGLATYPVLVYREDGFIDISCYDSEVGEWDCVGVVTHWMPIVPPRKEDKK